MAKKPKEKCEHGYSPVYMSGCAACVMAAMGAFRILRICKVTPEELVGVLRWAYPSQEAFDAAVAKVRDDERCATEVKGGK